MGGGEDRWSWQEKVNAERGRRGWSVTFLARKITDDGAGWVDPLQLRRYLRGKHAPREGLLVRIARVFGWPPEFLYRPDLPYGLANDRNKDWALMTLRSLDADGVRIVNALADDAARAHLRKALEQYEDLRARIVPPESARSPSASPPR